VHDRRRIVVREVAVIASVVLRECGSAASGDMALADIFRRVDPLADPPVQLTALVLRLAGIEEGRLILEMENQPQLEAGVRDGETDIVLSGQPNGCVEVRVVLRPFDIEDAPALVDLVIFASLHGALDQREWHSPARIDLDADRSVVTDAPGSRFSALM
jgi:hypothetical protein